MAKKTDLIYFGVLFKSPFILIYTHAERQTKITKTTKMTLNDGKYATRTVHGEE